MLTKLGLRGASTKGYSESNLNLLTLSTFKSIKSTTRICKTERGFFSIVRLNTRKIESSEAKRIKFVARIHIDNPFRCTVTDYSYFTLWKAFRAHRTVHQRRLLSVSPNLTTSYERRAFVPKSRSNSLSTVSSLRFRIKKKKDNSKVGS